MFTPEGELRPEFKFLETVAAPAPPANAPPPREEEPPEPPASPPPAAPAAIPRREPSADLVLPPGSGPAGTFFDLLSLIAEPASLYLGDLALPDGRLQVDLEMARLHIDLLAVLQEKTAGNLTAEEAAVLEDVLYQLRLRFLEKRRA